MSAVLTAPPAESSPSVPESTVFLLPGQLHASSAGSVVATVLGSCVSMCLVDPARRVGGINHFLLPSAEGHSTPDSTRFARPAMHRLIEQLVACGSTPGELEAKLFGGASVLGAAAGEGLGVRNVEVALALLGEAGIPVVASDVGGSRGRKLVFETQSGNAWVKLL